MQVLVYYTENSGQEFNRFRRIERWLLRERQRESFLFLMSGVKLRLTLTGAGQIKNVSVNERPAAGPAVRQMLDRVNPCAFCCLLPFCRYLFAWHGAERRKRAKQSHGRAARTAGERARTAYLMVCVFLRHCFVIAVHG